MDIESIEECVCIPMCQYEDDYIKKHVIKDYHEIGSWEQMSSIYYGNKYDHTGRHNGAMFDRIHEIMNKRRMHMLFFTGQHLQQFIQDHIKRPWGEITTLMIDCNVADVHTVNNITMIINTSIRIQQLMVRKHPPRCDCPVVCPDASTYLRIHLNDIAAGCYEEQIKDYLETKFTKLDIEKALAGEKFARLKETTKLMEKVRPGLSDFVCNPQHSGRRWQQERQPKERQPKEYQPKRLQPKKYRPTRLQACFEASSCQKKDCPFYHNLDVEHYNQSVWVTKKHCFVPNRDQSHRRH